MKIIEDIRINGNTEGSPISIMGVNIGYLFLKYIGNYSMMGGTVNILGIDVHFSDDIFDDNIKVTFNRNRTYNIFYMHLHINKRYFESLSFFKRYFESLSFFKRLEFLCKCIYKTLIEWAEKFSLPKEPITIAYKKIVSVEYFVEKQKKYKSKNNKYTCSIEYRNEYNFRTYRLVFKNNQTSEISIFFICEKEYFKDDELMKTDFMKWLNTPRDLEIIGWVNDSHFEMRWGEEKIIFNADTKTVEYGK